MNLREIAAQIPHGQSYFRRHAARYRKIWESLPKDTPLTILDIGVGYGFLAAAMKQAGHRVSAVDFFYGKVAEQVCSQFQIPLLNLNVESHELPFENENFDVVVLAEVIEHFTSDPVGTLKKIRRLLKEDGLLIVTTPNRQSAVNRIKRILGREDSLTYETPMTVGGDPYHYGHHRLFCMDELEAILQKSGYQICDKQIIFPGRVSPGGVIGFLGAVVIRSIGSLMPKLKNILLVVAKPL